MLVATLVSFWVGVEAAIFCKTQAGKATCVFLLINARQSPEMIIAPALVFT